MFYVLASLELIAEKIKDPFGGDASHVPTEWLAQNIQRCRCKNHLGETISRIRGNAANSRLFDYSVLSVFTGFMSAARIA